MIAGIDYLQGNAAVIMDADLQDPPELIPEMISWWEKGYDDICAKCRSRAGETFFKKWSSHTFYRILQHLTNIPIQPDVGDFRLLDKQCLSTASSPSAMQCLSQSSNPMPSAIKKSKNSKSSTDSVKPKKLPKKISKRKAFLMMGKALFVLMVCSGRCGLVRS